MGNSVSYSELAAGDCSSGAQFSLLTIGGLLVSAVYLVPEDHKLNWE